VVLEPLTTGIFVVIMSNMKAEPLLQERRVLAEDSFVELVVWQVPTPVAGSAHGFKYRLALVVKGICVLRYDNESGKGDHKHLDGAETPYAFKSPARLLADFWDGVNLWRS
jgi:hypothetical protein